MNTSSKKSFLKKLERQYFKLKRKMRLIPEDERVSFNTDTVYVGHFGVTYRGIQTLRCPFDYVIYQMIISEIKPDLIIEIGTNKGGTTLYLADLMNIIGHGMIHSIDITRSANPMTLQHPRVKLFDKGWQGYDLSEAAGFSKIMILEDGTHMYEDTIGTLRKFSPLVKNGSYLIIEDGIISELGREKGFHGGPLRAIREFLAENIDFKVDRKYCDLFGKNATFNVNGYLRREDSKG
jgi:cephalosporin hydroxylase